MLGDWDLPSTCFGGRSRLVRGFAGGPRMPAPARRQSRRPPEVRAILAYRSRSPGTDLASRYVLPLVEDFATEKLMESRIAPMWLLHGALALTIGAAFAFTRGWHWAAVAMLLSVDAARPHRPPPGCASASADRAQFLRTAAVVAGRRAGDAGVGLVGNASRQRLGRVRLRNRGGRVWAGLSARTPSHEHRASAWLVSRRNAVFLLALFAIGSAWTGFLIAVLVYAAISFFFVQFLVHRTRSELTPH